MRVLLIVAFCQILLCSQLPAAQAPRINGAVGYTEIIRFDYTKDGFKNKVQFWLEFNGSPSIGKQGDHDYTPETGSIYYYLYDVDNKIKIDNWLVGSSLMAGPPPRGPYPMSDIEVKGNTAQFSASGMKWTVIDGGNGYGNDIVRIDDGFHVREMALYNGNLNIISINAIDYSSKDCAHCHEDQTIEIGSKGGGHNNIECSECHVGHPPEEKSPFMQCTECHEPHSGEMTELDCSKCHRSHAASVVNYAFDVPAKNCAACHKEVADLLAGGWSKHSNISCALCHQKNHKDTSNCLYCHGAPHPDKTMTKNKTCQSCHNTAHQLKNISQAKK